MKGLDLAQGPQTCPDCGRDFSSPRGLSTHRRAAHAGEPSDSPPSQEKPVHGSVDAADTVLCPRGHPNPARQRFCGTCGTEILSPSSPTPPDSVPSPVRRRRWPYLAAFLVVVAAGSGTYLFLRQAQEQEKVEARQAAIQRFETCEEELEDVFEVLRGIDSRLDVGIQYDDYTEQIGDASVAYNAVDEGDISAACQDVHDQLDSVITLYSDVQEKWEDCIFATSCDTDTESLVWSVDWEGASTKIRSAEADLEGLDPRKASSSA